MKIYLYVYKFDYEISKTANEITEIPKAVKEVVSYLQKGRFFVDKKSFLIFESPSTKFL